MEPFFTVADLFSRTALHGHAYSALPDAPVLSDKRRRALRTRTTTYLRRRVRTPNFDLRRAQYRPECSAS